MKSGKIQKVLIALDYDPTAQKIAETGFSMAKAMDAEVILLHIISDPVYYSTTEYSPIMGLTEPFNRLGLVKLNSVEEVKKATLNFLEKIKRHLGDETIKTRVGEGDYAESILEMATVVHADFIVMGSHSRKWLENILMGSVVEKVLRNTTIPLFIIPTKQKS
jgi:nucleotide-binding universal stress UspA family protein